jgi:hypothetical protein
VEWSWCYGADAWTGGSGLGHGAMHQVVTSWWVWCRVRLCAIWYAGVQDMGLQELCCAPRVAGMNIGILHVVRVEVT